MRRPIARIAALIVFAAASLAAETPFPEPLHLTREVTDPLTGATSVIEEYYEGSRAVAISGDRVAVADYAWSTLLSIDRKGKTFSMVRFDELARARSELVPERRAAAATRPALVRAESREGATVEIWSARDAELSIEIAVSRATALSRDAIEIILGTRFPGTDDPVSSSALKAAAPGGGSDRAAAMAGSYGLPVEIRIRRQLGADTAETMQRVTRIGRERVPPAAIAIPNGAREVEADLLRAATLLRQLDLGGAR